ncbi:unnamed protein product [Meganyctiphanes norvegica]|uniref:C-type lectin domain-containing protein n=1 Tax=Meganyctiphanes norvegica TaxID=48144 RepID=A0AAV2R8E0_MEGNR
MKRVCIVLVVLLGHQALAEPKRGEDQHPMLDFVPEDNLRATFAPAQTCSSKITETCSLGGGFCVAEPFQENCGNGTLKIRACTSKYCACCIPPKVPSCEGKIQNSCINQDGSCVMAPFEDNCKEGRLIASGCYGKQCMCCAPIKAPSCEGKILNSCTNKGGSCVMAPFEDNCKDGRLITNGCSGKHCQCCAPVKVPSCEGKIQNSCTKKGGSCVMAPFKDNCKEGKLISKGCQGKDCECCAPEKTPSCEGKLLNSCAKKGGSCVLAPFQDNCQGTLIERACTGSNCQCCVPMKAPSCEGKLLNSCAKKGGHCVLAPFQDNCRGKLIERACSGTNCQCCIPDPTPAPTAAPTPAPTAAPTPAPTAAPTPAPTVAPTPAPTAAPTPAPTAAPTPAPTAAPTPAPTAAPTPAPTAAPTPAPTAAPTPAPTAAPTPAPTAAPTPAPTAAPTPAPTQATTKKQTNSATKPAPTQAPTQPPTQAPTQPPIQAPTQAPTQPKTQAPTQPPTQAPTQPPTQAPTQPPTQAPTQPPTQAPTQPPTQAPTQPPTQAPTQPPTQAPTQPPTQAPTQPPTQAPTQPPTQSPTQPPTQAPTQPPTQAPTQPPTQAPTQPPTHAPTQPPTQAPTQPPTQAPTQPPTQAPTQPPTQAPTQPPTQAPTQPPTQAPTQPPTQAPTQPPTHAPTQPPTQAPTQPPTQAPTQPPTQAPTQPPTQAPTQPPTQAPTQPPTQAPTQPPTQAPTQPPTHAPTQPPTQAPTQPPTQAPTQPPTQAPTQPPTQAPTQPPTQAPTLPPTQAPTLPPTEPAQTTPAPPKTTVAPKPANLCPKEFSLQGSQCLYVNDVDTLNWEDARDACVDKGARLLVPADVNEFEKFADENYNGKEFWLGASDQDSEGEFVWLNGEALQSGFPWGFNQPDNFFIEDCLMYPYKGSYNDYSCSRKLHYVCESLPVPPCPQDFFLKGSQCLHVNDVDTLTWEMARDSCASKGSRLLIPADFNKLQTFVDAKYNGNQFWLGASDRESEGTWVWINGEPLQSGFPWGFLQPDNWFNEDCLMYPFNGAYNDFSCNDKLHYICEACPTGYVLVGHQCLSFNTDEKLSWQEASDKCEANGDSLAVVEDYATLQEYIGENYDVQEVDWSIYGADVGATSSWSSSYEPKEAFSDSYYWHSESGSSLPQTIWFKFTQAISIKKFSFSGKNKNYVPTKYIFFGTNSDDCSDESSWTTLIEKTYEGQFVDPTVDHITNSKKFTCYGFKITKSLNSDYTSLKKLKFYATNLDVQEVEWSIYGSDLGATTSWSSSYEPKEAVSEDGRYWHNGRGTSLPQTVWFKFSQAIIIKRYSFTGKNKNYVPTEYTFFGSNSDDCSDESVWTVLIEKTSDSQFVDPTVDDVDNNKEFTCYGFKIIKSHNAVYTTLKNLKFYATNLNVHKVDWSLYGAELGASSSWSSSYEPKEAILEGSHYWHSAHGSSLPQTIWFKFTKNMIIKKYSFSAKNEANFPTEYVFFGSNSDDCSDESIWTSLLEKTSDSPFVDPAVDQIDNNQPFTCYGFKITKSKNSKYTSLNDLSFYDIDTDDRDREFFWLGGRKSGTVKGSPLTSYYGPHSKIWNDYECKNLGNYFGNSLTECSDICDTTVGCTAMNYKEGSCVMRECALPISQPIWDNSPWVGYSKSKLAGEWDWMNGGYMVNIPWGPNEPNNVGGEEDCFDFITNHGYNDNLCSRKSFFVCDKGI